MHLRFLELGHLHISIFGVFAALGLMGALALSQHTARFARLAPEAVWNAGMTAIVSAFVISRLLLAAFNLHSFLQYPLLLLSLPSLTTSGLLLTALFMLGYVRWRKLALVSLLDSTAPCAALLWAFLTLGRYFEGTRDGMPVHLPGLAGGADSIVVRPVELYTFAAASLLCVALLRTLSSNRPSGHTAGMGLIACGLAIFFIDFFRIPSDLLANIWLDPSQIMGVAMILVGATLLLSVRPQIEQESGIEPPHAI